MPAMKPATARPARENWEYFWPEDGFAGGVQPRR